MEDSIDIEIVKHSHTDTMVWCRHWDTIRWTSFAATITAMGASAYANPVVLYAFKSFFLTLNCMICLILALLYLYLLKNLLKYHINIVDRHNKLAETLIKNETYKKVFTIDLPFEFSMHSHFKCCFFKCNFAPKGRPATQLLPILILIIAIMFSFISNIKAFNDKYVYFFTLCSLADSIFI